jgi:adenine-specific DNA-methyltransferase
LNKFSFDTKGFIDEMKKIYGQQLRRYGDETACIFIKSLFINKVVLDKAIKNIVITTYEIPEALKRKDFNFNLINDGNQIGKIYESLINRNSKKAAGLFYTPASVVRDILESTVQKADIVKNPFIKVLDPSCGSGYFLSKAYDILKCKFENNIEELREKCSQIQYRLYDGKLINGKVYWQKNNIHYHILKNCIFGADIDSTAVKLTKINLLLKDVYNTSCEVNILECDSLIKWENKLDHSLKEYKFWSQKFEYVIGNPPWVSLSRKHGQFIKEELKQYYIDQYNGNNYSPNLCEYFIKRAMKICIHSIGYIVPSAIAVNLQYSELRKYILHNYNIRKLIFEIKFPAIVTDSMILILEKGLVVDNLIVINNGRSIVQKQFLQEKNYEFIYKGTDLDEEIKTKIWDNSNPLGDIATTFTGFIGDTQKISCDRVTNEQIKILKGENIRSYITIGEFYYDFKRENIKGGTSDLRKLTCKDKILVRKTGNKIIATIDTSGRIIEQSLYGVIKINPDYCIEYLLGVLNSKLILWYFSNYLITNKNSMPQIKKYSLDNIPIKNCDKMRQEKIKNIVIEILSKVKEIDIRGKRKWDEKEISKLEDDLNIEIFSVYNIDIGCI